MHCRCVIVNNKLLVFFNNNWYYLTITSHVLLLVHCPAGTFAGLKQKQCTYCPRGFYQNRDRQGSCLRCPQGTYTREEGTKTIHDCVPVCGYGTYSPTGMVSSNNGITCKILNRTIYLIRSHVWNVQETVSPANRQQEVSKTAKPVQPTLIRINQLRPVRIFANQSAVQDSIHQQVHAEFIKQIQVLYMC